MSTSGISGVEAEELAIFPGMEELSAMMYVNQYRREARYDVIILDCAPTAESLRISLAFFLIPVFASYPLSRLEALHLTRRFG